METSHEDGLDGQSPPGPGKKSKLGYTRISVACTNCRKRKIRCERSKSDLAGRCANCIKLRRECVYAAVDNSQPSNTESSAPGQSLGTQPSSATISRSPSAFEPGLDGYARESTTLPLPVPDSPEARMMMPLQHSWSQPQNSYGGYPIFPGPPRQPAWNDARTYSSSLDYNDGRSRSSYGGMMMADGHASGGGWHLPEISHLGMPPVHQPGYLHNEQQQQQQQRSLQSNMYYGSYHDRQAPVTVPSQAEHAGQYYPLHQSLPEDASVATGWDASHGQQQQRRSISPRHDSMWQHHSGYRAADEPRHGAPSSSGARDARGSRDR